MGSIKFSIKRPVTIFMCMCVIVILGIVSISKMDNELMPSMEIPVAAIITTYSGAGPEEVESLVTNVVEGAISSVENLDTFSSTSSEGMSLVIVQFNYGTDMEKAVTHIRDKISSVSRMLPDDVEDPTILKMDMNAQAIAQVGITSDVVKDQNLKALVEEQIKPIIERSPGVGSVDFFGGKEQEITITINPERLEGLGLSMSQLAGIIASENDNKASGQVDYGEKTLTISSKLKLTSVEDIKKIPINIGKGSILQLQDIATVELKDKEIETISRLNGKDCITLSITKTSDGNIVSTIKEINKVLEKIQKEYPDIKAEMIYESGSMVEESINNVLKNIAIGALLAMITLFVFLKNIGMTAIIAISMPLSITLTIVLLYFCGVTLNMISLGGISIGVGMLVDNSVVVIENIYRYRTTEGFGKIKGTFRATVEVLPSIVASTLTSVVIFLPFLFTEGMVKEMFSSLALSVVFSLLSSLLMSITVVPMIAGNYINNVHRNKAPKPLGFINYFLNGFDWLIKKLNAGYAKVLRVVIRCRKRTLLIVLTIFISSMMLYSSLGMELFPSTDMGWITIDLTVPSGTKIEVMNEIATHVEDKVLQIPEIKSLFLSLSEGNGSLMMSAGSAQIMADVGEKSERERGIDEIAEDIRQRLKDIAGADIKVSSMSMMGTLSDPSVTVNIEGDELDTLKNISEELMFQIKNVPGTREVTSSTDSEEKQIAIVMDKDKLRQYGLTGPDVANQIRGSVKGSIATSLKVDGAETDIRLIYPQRHYKTLSSLEDISIKTGMGTYIPLSSIATIEREDVLTQIERKDKTRYVTVAASVYGRDIGSTSKDIQSIIDQMNFPEGYSVTIGGNNEVMNETFMSLLLVIVLAIILVYAVMAAQFESLINPFIIMFTIPLALTGAFLLLFLMRETLSMVAMLGCLVLVGIVVNNGIILIDYINTLRFRDGEELEDAVLTACPTRLRPILMTALTTILGQIPVILSTGSSSETLKGMGIVIAGGLTTSTLLTLIVVPILYIQFDGIVNRLRRLFKLQKKRNRYEIEKECC